MPISLFTFRPFPFSVSSGFRFMRVSKLEAKLETKDSTKTQQNTPQPNPIEAQQLDSVQQQTFNKSDNNNFKEASQRTC